MVLSVLLQQNQFPLNACDFFLKVPHVVRPCYLFSVYRNFCTSLCTLCAPYPFVFPWAGGSLLKRKLSWMSVIFFKGTRVGPMAHYSSANYCRDHARTHVKLMFHPQHNSMPNQSFLLLWPLPHPSSKRVCINSIVNYSNFRMYFFLTSVLCLVL
jgi:hypothetical protein